MATFLSEFSISVNDKWAEIDLLLKEANIQRNKNEELYNALCRSITVLSYAHFEGFLKDLLKSLINDLNKNVKFKNLPNAIKRTYCRKYIGTKSQSEESNYENKINNLVQKFEEMDCKISHDPFYTSVSKNPKPDLLKNVFSNLGITEIFSHLHESEFEQIFSSSINENKNLFDSLQTDINENIKEFPYTFKSNTYKLYHKNTKIKNTIWETFLDDFNRKRHEVAHGTNFGNVSDINELEIIKIKIMIIELCLLGILSNFITEQLEKVMSPS